MLTRSMSEINHRTKSEGSSRTSSFQMSRRCLADDHFSLSLATPVSASTPWLDPAGHADRTCSLADSIVDLERHPGAE